jgi:hypothetical protein
MIDSVPGFTERFAERDDTRLLKSYPASGEASFWRGKRSNASIRRVATTSRGVDAVEIVRAQEIGVENGCPAMRTPRSGFETEVERRSRRSDGSAKVILCGVEGAGREL